MYKEEQENSKSLFTVRIDTLLLEEYRNYCRKHKRTISGQLELILEDFLEKNKDREVIR